jgi:hypothetical protein
MLEYWSVAKKHEVPQVLICFGFPPLPYSITPILRLPVDDGQLYVIAKETVNGYERGTYGRICQRHSRIFTK